MTTYHYRKAGTDQTATLEVPEGHEPPVCIMVPIINTTQLDRYQLVTPPKPNPQWKFLVTWDNGQSTTFEVNEEDVLFHTGELIRDRVCKTFRVVKP
jgi:hypothetical protein